MDKRLHLGDMADLIDLYQDSSFYSLEDPTVHDSNLHNTNRTCYVVENVRLNEFEVYLEGDYDKLFQHLYAENLMSSERWFGGMKAEFEDFGADAELIARYEAYLEDLEKGKEE